MGYLTLGLVYHGAAVRTMSLRYKWPSRAPKTAPSWFRTTDLLFILELHQTKFFIDIPAPCSAGLDLFYRKKQVFVRFLPDGKYFVLNIHEANLI